MGRHHAILFGDTFDGQKRVTLALSRGVNAFRGEIKCPIVNEEDLLVALNESQIAGAALDVLNQEPPSADHPLVNHEKVVVTPHTAGITRQSFDALGRTVADNIERLKKGQPLRNLATI